MPKPKKTKEKITLLQPVSQNIHDQKLSVSPFFPSPYYERNREQFMKYKHSRALFYFILFSNIQIVYCIISNG